MDDIYSGLLAQLLLFEEFYSLSRKETKLVNKIKKCLRELITLYEKEII